MDRRGIQTSTITERRRRLRLDAHFAFPFAPPTGFAGGMHDALLSRVAAGLQAVRARTDYLHAHFGRAESKWKHDGTRVTPADLAISHQIFAELGQQFPEDQFFSEETEPGGATIPVRTRFCWILDPIDGTNNYALGIPMCAISLALLADGMPVCGFIYDLGVRSLIHGGPDIGLFAEGAPIPAAISGPGEIEVVALHSPVDALHLPLVQAVLSEFKLRAFGSGALHLTYVALGRIEACIDLTVRVWDIAAAWAFCRHNGIEIHFFDAPVFPLRVFDLHMKPLRYLAGAPVVCGRLIPKLKAAGICFAD